MPKLFLKAFQRKKNFSVVFCRVRVANWFEGFPEDEVYTDAYFGSVAHIEKGFNRVGYCNVAYEHQDCIIVGRIG